MPYMLSGTLFRSLPGQVRGQCFRGEFPALELLMRRSCMRLKKAPEYHFLKNEGVLLRCYTRKSDTRWMALAIFYWHRIEGREIRACEGTERPAKVCSGG